MKIRKNGDVITLTENDLKKIVKKVLVTEAPMREMKEDQIILSTKPSQADLGGRYDYYVENTKDTVRGKITPLASNEQGAGKSLKVYEFNLTSPIQGCKALILEDTQSKYDKGLNVKASINPTAHGQQVGDPIHYALSGACKKGIYNRSMRDKNDHVVDVGTVKIETNGGDWDTKIRFTGKMKSTGSKTDI